MRSYSKISHALWQSERFNNLPSDDARYLYLFLLTSSHQTSAGAYRLPDGYACADLRWPPERYIKARQQLVDADLLAFDADCSVIFIRRWFKHNPPMNDSHLKSIEGELGRLSSETLAQIAMAELAEAQSDIEVEKMARANRNRKPGQASALGQGAGIPARFQTNLLSR